MRGSDDELEFVNTLHAYLPCRHAEYTEPSSDPTTKLLTSFGMKLRLVAATDLPCLCCQQRETEITMMG